MIFVFAGIGTPWPPAQTRNRRWTGCQGVSLARNTSPSDVSASKYNMMTCSSLSLSLNLGSALERYRDEEMHEHQRPGKNYQAGTKYFDGNQYFPLSKGKNYQAGTKEFDCNQYFPLSKGGNLQACKEYLVWNQYFSLSTSNGACK